MTSGPLLFRVLFSKMELRPYLRFGRPGEGEMIIESKEDETSLEKRLDDLEKSLQNTKLKIENLELKIENIQLKTING